VQSIDEAPTSTRDRSRRRAVLIAGWVSVLLASGLSLALPTDATADGIGPHTSLDGVPASVPLSAVESAVVAAKTWTALPSVLVPSIATASSDGVNLHACSQYPRLTRKVCNLGDPTGTKTLVVFGNSHSVMWVPALALIAKAEGWKLYPIVREACGYEVFVNLGQFWKSTNPCSTFYVWAKATITRIHPDVIVMGSYDESPGWAAGEEQIVRQLKPLTKRFILLGDDVGGVAPETCLAQAGATQGTCARPEGSNARELEAHKIAVTRKVDFLDIRPLMCDDQTCPAVIAGFIPTKDSAHLTPQFSAFVAPALALALNLGGRNTIKMVPIAVPPMKPVWPGATTTTTTTTTTVASVESASTRGPR
jgi:SGNH domain-containing protein